MPKIKTISLLMISVATLSLLVGCEKESSDTPPDTSSSTASFVDMSIRFNNWTLDEVTFALKYIRNTSTVWVGEGGGGSTLIVLGTVTGFGSAGSRDFAVRLKEGDYYYLMVSSRGRDFVMVSHFTVRSDRTRIDYHYDPFYSR